jgi:sec-independent protein translocase protein TatA
MNLGLPEIIGILAVALLVFGPKKLPELGKSLGQGIREFKKSTQEIRTDLESSLKDEPSKEINA